jgi:hypothetical protein
MENPPAVPPARDADEALDDPARVTQINNRVSEMQRQYLQWARSAKRGYHFWNLLAVIFGAAVPVVVLVAQATGSTGNAPWVPASAGILGAAATLAKSIDSIFKNHDTWLRNNSAYGKISSERFLFEERAGQYKNLADPDRITLYAQRVNDLIGSESDQWTGTENAPPGDTRS